MADGGARVASLPRFAWAIPAAFLGLLLPARAGVAVGYGNGAAGVGVVVALFVLPLLYTVPRGRVVWDRHPWWLLSAQAVLTYVPFVMFGQAWVVGLSGLLGGLVLLSVRAPLSWLLLGAVIAVEGVLRIGVYGVHPDTGVSAYTWVFVVPIDMALPLFGLVRLSDLVADLHAARTELAELAVTRERLQAAARLRTAVGDRLEAVTARSRATLAALSHSPDEARAHLAEAGGIARKAAEQVRRTVTAGRPVHGGPASRRTGRTVAPRLALLVLVIDLGLFAGHHVAKVVDSPAGPALTTAGVAAIVAIAALQVYHSVAGRPGRRPFGWRVTLPVQALLPFTGYVSAPLFGMPSFPAGSALLLLTGRRAWVAFAAISSSMAVYWLLREPDALDAVVYLAGLSASTGLAVYGLSRLRDLAEELEATRWRLARAAAVQERLRVDQDTHDLLGLGLSAIALKCDLAGRLIGRDDARAQAELQALVRLTAQARADIRAVTTGAHGLSLRTELDAARDVLTTAGIRVEVRPVTPGVSLPSDVDAAFATVLREAVTNVLRHSRATWCDIELTADAATVSVRVANDGVSGPPPVPAGAQQQGRRVGGHGLANLAARMAARGGWLTTNVEDGRFELTAHVPLPAGGSGQAGREDPFVPGNPAHGVDEVVGGAVLDEEP
jgi:two-component system, NarL family, sensor histidine kinase DesK